MATAETILTSHPTPLPHPVSRRGEPAWEVAMLFPTQGNWSEEDYLGLDHGHLMIELVDGCLEVLPMVSVFHQLVVQFLFKLFDAYVIAHALGQILLAPCAVHLRRATYREPDLFFLKSERVGDPRSQPEGADLALEVVSPGKESRKRDLEDKREDYARAGVAEYWIVDPEEHCITVLTLEGSAYRVHGKFGRGETATSVLLAGFSVSVDATFAAGNNPAGTVS